jgi:hypothetical protein
VLETHEDRLSVKLLTDLVKALQANPITPSFSGGHEFDSQKSYDLFLKPCQMNATTDLRTLYKIVFCLHSLQAVSHDV